MARTGRPVVDLGGKVFGFLEVLQREGRARNGAVLWRCGCAACGKETVLAGGQLTSGKNQSCGCSKRTLITQRKTRHGHNKVGERSSEYRIWALMKDRCNNPKSRAYKDYGGRGIRVHPAWENSFEQFLKDVGSRPHPGLSLDRFPDKNGNYEPGNVRWATRDEQANNTRKNRLITFNGLTKTLSQWGRITGLRPGLIAQRLDALGWTVERALTQSKRGACTTSTS